MKVSDFDTTILNLNGDDRSPLNDESVVFVTRSINEKNVRLTRRIWRDKILIDHPEFSLRKDEYSDEVEKTISEPDFLVNGWAGELVAVRRCEIAPNRPKYLCVIYRELNGEGFVITTFFISKLQKLLRRGVIWGKQKK